MYKNYIKRFIDFSLAIIGLLILSPIIFTLFIILLFTNNGKPFYFQKRPGKNEKIFKIIKFKSMSDKTDENNNLLPDKDRRTKVGTFIRKYSLDEIPQLFNVLIGDMSIIGPRPLRVKYLPYYTETESIRHTVRPGVTGLAQVSGRNSISWDDKLKKDIEYVNNLSFSLDFYILLKTVQKVINSSDIELSEDIPDFDVERKLKQHTHI